MKPRRPVLALPILALSLIAAAVAAAPLAREQVPEPLRPWVDWALHGSESQLCPALAGSPETLRCAWPARLDLQLDAGGGRFTQEWLAVAEEWAVLPGDGSRVPLDVRLDGQPAAVVRRGGQASVRLAAGRHTIAGVFRWDALPEALQVPAETGLVALVLAGKPVAFPSRDAQGRLWLSAAAGGEQGEDRLDILVHRRLTDDIPLTVLTRIDLQVAGRNREVVLGRALLDGFVPMTLASPVAARMDPDGRLRVQVRPGSWAIDLVARHQGPVSALALAPAGGPWADEEVWAFEARSHLRLVTVEGVPAIDPRQTTVPDEWRSLPTYRIRPGETMTLAERRRGDTDPAPDQLRLERTWWLDFDGGGYTIEDRLSGSLRRSFRLEMAAPTALGRVAIGGDDQFITRLGPGAREGVEVRQGEIDLVAESRLEGRRSAIPAVGWDHDLHEMSGTINLPPGFRLLAASGADDVPGTWLRSWTLLDLFLLLVLALATARLWGRRWGAAALAALVLALPEPDAARWAWVVVLTAEALARALPDGRLRQLALGFRLAARVGLAIVVGPFLVAQARQGLYPGLTLDNAYGAGYGRVQVMSQATPAAPAGVTAPTESMALGRLESAAEEKAGQENQPVQRGNIAAKRAVEQLSYSNLKVHDPRAMVQTGPGLPQWQWTAVPIRFSGPVEKSQALRLRLISPGWSRALCLLRVFLIGALALRLIGGRAGSGGLGGGTSATTLATASILAVLAVAPSPAGAAELPPPELLEQLRARLLERPACFPDCASISRLVVIASPLTLELRLEAAAAAPAAIPLPGGLAQWTPARVAIDGEDARALARDSRGTLWLLLPAGVHQVTVTGPLPDRESVALPLLMAPARVEARAEGWVVDGVHEDGVADQSLRLSRERKPSGAATAPAEGDAALPPFVRVERSLLLGLAWEAETRVVRETPLGAPVVLEVPLLAGEAVTTAGVRVEGGKALVNLGAQVDSIAWRSRITETPRLELVAAETGGWTEVWRLSASPIWHYELSGIPVIHATEDGARLPEWRPWPGEAASIAVSRPEGVGGQTLTIDRSVLALVPGARATDATLDLDLRSSRGGQHALRLPAGALLESVTIGGEVQPIRQEGRAVSLPLVPGARQVRLAWREPRGIGLRLRSSEVDLGIPSVNAEIHLAVPRGRWLLLGFGPRLGPAVLVWGVLAILALLSYFLGRLDLTPLRAHHWFLLGLGLTQASVWVWVLVGGWLVALGRRRQAGTGGRNLVFDLGQVLLVLWTLVAVGLLVWSLQQGLLGQPEMQVAGNGSTRDLLRWYQDRSGPTLPQAAVISLPLPVYRVGMLAWALWLAVSFLGWLRWGFAGFCQGGIWRPLRRPAEAEGRPRAGSGA